MSYSIDVQKSGGGPKVRAKFRIAWSIDGCGWAPTDDGRLKAYKDAKARGVAGLRWVEGASARDAQIKRAEIAAEKADRR